LSATVAVATRAAITTVDPASIGLYTNKLTALRAALAKEVVGGRIPSAVMLIARQGKLGGVKWPDSRHQKMQPMTSKTVFRIYSMTKPIFSVGP